MKTRCQDLSHDSDTFKHPIMLFDGECRFCSGSVQLIIRLDQKDVFRFAQLQSDTAQSLLPPDIKNDPSMDSVILLDQGFVYTHSDAMLQICRRLGRGWALLSVLKYVPVSLRDFLYRWVAKRRYKLFGKQEHCMIPTAEIRRKFI
ncbi:thiol-disulfide oxidoreductase DCC family protein [Paenibacillus sp. OAS669]|uniref:thiol-disulfide oxidoreductase DCC family protein n=1 Tax=Paenibacillus sp. OAS669 TaxID=2663821 RepID=UPI00178C05AA|nr:DCC1-like thiol-disulfide oxidoreductase family protein [Paenibacillus sp. OAS669]MBE1447462.1 putative DCC family thiol-disulfide oxidoreductase YuxK [Paenibacillus sp. OAS669]